MNKNEYWEWKGYERQRDKPLNKQTIAKPWPQEGHSHEEERNWACSLNSSTMFTVASRNMTNRKS